eukprot:sb/3466536/
MADNTTDKYTLLLSMEQRAPLIIFDTIAILLVFFGNGAVLYFSIRYNAIKLDKISLIFVQNLAAADFLMGVFFVLPIWSSIVANRFVLGDFGCYLSAQLPFLPWIMNSLLVLSITAYRLLVATNPFRRVSCLSVRIFCGILWAVGLSIFAIQIGFGSTAEFEGHAGKCASSIYKDEKTATLFLVYVVICLSLTPLCFIIILNAILGVIAFRSSKCVRARSHYKGLIMVCFLSGLFVISWLPWGISTIANLAHNPITWKFMRLLSYHFSMLNCIGNPILYTLTNRKFARFTTQICHRKLAELSNNKSSSATGERGGGDSNINANNSVEPQQTNSVV